ncbi:bifunctional diaminohydroxyphosphoribosylaminopyrimidine deaminase/5-amino-6-(5-phosphoribosylamino)uracil reductase RibD [Elioraea sp.]|uniref:bifunctional diaminohydroxyphosphoribosylaminopyrimidine deaminase/5-amino-6-(5-phosphoribosylamino)uracil reductase RibD n=1 Tax=Elioraea sp. TaxID=2185103 RepID=UPI0025BDF0B7|nr:bifunctional diaminohydroxyphosphoribosylaminopyrimidine deaminase/5-amino-6-(5-phosphoribosylamino)uracil reductase RibD [Elioraea sp.]
MAVADDLAWMRAALTLARRGLGNVWPNPAVGCVIVKDGVVVGRGWTQPGGRPHAETEALGRAGEKARGATAYVTLEPCCHWGRTPPCTDAMIAAGIARAVIAMRDPDPRVNGEGVSRLLAAGIDVTEGVAEAEAQAVNQGFVSRIRAGRPMVTLKLAATLDGRIAAAGGESRWITGAPSRRLAHMLRATHDAILVGASTATSDDPALTVRLPGVVPPGRPGPVRVVADGRLRLPLTSVLVATARETPTWVLTLPGNDQGRISALAEAGCTVIAVAPDRATGQPDMAEGLRTLGARGITRLLVEGGGTIAASLLAAGLVDRLAWFGAPALLGADAVPAVGALAIPGIAAMPRFRRIALTEHGDDVLLHLVREE